jgi:hypothetical protein
VPVSEQRQISLIQCPTASKNVVDEMSEENYQQQTSDATKPEEKMLGQLWGVDFFLVHLFAFRKFDHE